MIEQDEDMSRKKGPQIEDLVKTESVDVLHYIAWPEVEEVSGILLAVLFG